MNPSRSASGRSAMRLTTGSPRARTAAHRASPSSHEAPSGDGPHRGTTPGEHCVAHRAEQATVASVRFSITKDRDAPAARPMRSSTSSAASRQSAASRRRSAASATASSTAAWRTGSPVAVSTMSPSSRTVRDARAHTDRTPKGHMSCIGADQKIDMAGDGVVHGRAAAPIGHMDEPHARLLRQQRHGEVTDAAAADRGIADRLGLGSAAVITSPIVLNGFCGWVEIT